MTSVNTLSAAVEDSPFTITYASFAAAANEGDSDGDPISFRVENITTGTLTKDGNPIDPGVTLLSTGESLVWTAAADANGILNAFTVRAYDGDLVRRRRSK